MARRLFTQELTTFIINTLKAKAATSIGGDGSLPTLVNIQQGRFSQFRAPAKLDTLLDLVMVIPTLVVSSIGPRIPGSTSQYIFRCIYIRKTASDELINLDTTNYTQILCEAIMDQASQRDINVPGLELIRIWPERIDWEPEEDRMFETISLTGGWDITAWNIIVDTLAALY